MTERISLTLKLVLGNRIQAGMSCLFTAESLGKTLLHEDMMLGDLAALLQPQGATPEMKVSSLKW